MYSASQTNANIDELCQSSQSFSEDDMWKRVEMREGERIDGDASP